MMSEVFCVGSVPLALVARFSLRFLGLSRYGFFQRVPPC
jgi:hypothetical protein